MDSRLLCGDVREVLPTLVAGSVQCVVTSPPYWGLRDYGTATWEGGTAECDHRETGNRNDGGRSRLDGFNGSKATDSDKGASQYRNTCRKCGAKRIDNQIGLEPTPEAYVTTMVKVFREVKRVLRDDGTLWLNLGDSYAGSTQSGGKAGLNGPSNGPKHDAHAGVSVGVPRGLKPKDLVGIPWRVAFALQADGWYLRSDIIWAKGVSFCPDYSGSVMPESVTDRPTKSHEYLFLLTKSARYFYDADAVRERAIHGGEQLGIVRGQKRRASAMGAGVSPSGNEVIGADATIPDGRNLRSVWTLNPQPYREAHFATFPTTLVEPCVKAGSKKGDTVLDPFAGSGTTGLVAGKLGLEFVGIELNADYIRLAKDRIEGPLFAASGRPSLGHDVQGESQDRSQPSRLDDGRPEPAKGQRHA